MQADALYPVFLYAMCSQKSYLHFPSSNADFVHIFQEIVLKIYV